MTEETKTPRPADVAGRLDGLVMLDGTPTKQGWYWCCEAYSPYAMYVVWVFRHGGHGEHEMTFEEAAEIEAQWWGPIQAPEDPEYYGTSQPREHNVELTGAPPNGGASSDRRERG